NAIIVLSGGEPLLHQKNTDFKDFLRFLIEQNRQVHFESNGTIEPDFKALPELKNCYFALSVKLENSGESKEKRINARALKSIFVNSKGALSRNCLA
ncbi:MAG: 4Fe-4S cluster-binding domain-containing protein, partial [Campylobacter sp.]